MTKPKQDDNAAKLKLYELQNTCRIEDVANMTGIPVSRLRGFYRGEINSLMPIEHERIMELEV